MPRSSNFSPAPTTVPYVVPEASTSPGRRQRGDARGDVDGHAAHVVADDLALAGVQADADLEARAARTASTMASRAAHRVRRRAVEGDEEGVADRLDLAPAEAVELAAHGGLVGAEQVAPARVAQARGVAGRADDVAEDHRQQVARDRCASARR